MKKIVSAFLTVIMVFSMLSVMIVGAYAAASENEPNGSLSSADTLALDEAISGKISSSYDSDYFKIAPNKNGTLVVSFERGVSGSADTWSVSVYDDATLIANKVIHDGWGLPDVTTIATIDVVAGGVYYVVVEDGNESYQNDSTYLVSTSFKEEVVTEEETEDEDVDNDNSDIFAFLDWILAFFDKLMSIFSFLK